LAALAALVGWVRRDATPSVDFPPSFFDEHFVTF